MEWGGDRVTSDLEWVMTVMPPTAEQFADSPPEGRDPPMDDIGPEKIKDLIRNYNIPSPDRTFLPEEKDETGTTNR